MSGEERGDEELSLKEQAFIKKVIDEAVDDRVGGALLRIKWFGWGLGATLAILIASGLVTQSNLVLEVLGKATNFEGYMSQIFEKKIAVSYHNQFWLGTGEGEDKVKKLIFYAGPGQTAEMRIDVAHVGPSERLKVRVWLDESNDDPIYERADNGPYQKDLVQLGEHTHQGSRPHPNVHELHFEIVEGFETVAEDGQTIERPIEDRIFIAAMLNVYGREK